jgi:hypothetical protein
MDLNTWLPAITGLIGLGLGAALQYYSARTIERNRHFDELRSRAYVDFIRAVAATAIGGKDWDSTTAADALADLADAKVRIALYGSDEAVKSLAQFCRTDQQLGSPEAQESFIRLTTAMRKDALRPGVNDIAEQDVKTILFQR